MYYDSNTTSVVPQNVTETAELQRLVIDFLPYLQASMDETRQYFEDCNVQFNKLMSELRQECRYSHPFRARDLPTWVVAFETTVLDEFEAFPMFSELRDYLKRHSIPNPIQTPELAPPILVLPLSYGLYAAMHMMDKLAEPDDFVTQLSAQATTHIKAALADYISYSHLRDYNSGAKIREVIKLAYGIELEQ